MCCRGASAEWQFHPVPDRANKSRSLGLRGMQGNYTSSTSWLMNFFLPLSHLPLMLTWLVSYKELFLKLEEFLVMREIQTFGNAKKLNNFLQKGLFFWRGKCALIALVCIAPTYTQHHTVHKSDSSSCPQSACSSRTDTYTAWALKLWISFT